MENKIIARAAIAEQHLKANPDRWAFLLKIAENYADVAPKLVFADWLAENGEEDFAAYICAQCSPRTHLTAEEKKSIKIKARKFHKDRHWLGTSGVPIKMSFSNGLPEAAEVASMEWYRACGNFIAALGPRQITITQCRYEFYIGGIPLAYEESWRADDSAEHCPWGVIRFLAAFSPQIVWRTTASKEGWGRIWHPYVQVGLNTRVGDFSRAFTDAARV